MDRPPTVPCAVCGRALYPVTNDPDVTHRCARCACAPDEGNEAMRHPVTGRFMAGDCERDCQQHCAGLWGACAPDEVNEAET
jgi:hypothetical protein